MDEKTIVKKIRELRLSRNMTLERLADLTGLTKGYLSRIEHSPKSPPVSTLAGIAKALEYDITQFFTENAIDETPPDISVIKKDERLKMGRRGAPFGYIYEALAYRTPGKNMEPYIITISREFSEAEFQHEGEEFIFILDGQLAFFYKGQTHILEKGDSVYFNSGFPHSGKSIGKKRAKFLCIIFSYRRL
jgi:transcriptional regulator with XRE-family HTH domain